MACVVCRRHSGHLLTSTCSFAGDPRRLHDFELFEYKRLWDEAFGTVKSKYRTPLGTALWPWTSRNCKTSSRGTAARGPRKSWYFAIRTQDRASWTLLGPWLAISLESMGNRTEKYHLCNHRFIYIFWMEGHAAHVKISSIQSLSFRTDHRVSQGWAWASLCAQNFQPPNFNLFERQDSLKGQVEPSAERLRQFRLMKHGNSSPSKLPKFHRPDQGLHPPEPWSSSSRGPETAGVGWDSICNILSVIVGIWKWDDPNIFYLY